MSRTDDATWVDSNSGELTLHPLTLSNSGCFSGPEEWGAELMMVVSRPREAATTSGIGWDLGRDGPCDSLPTLEKLKKKVTTKRRGGYKICKN